MRQKLLPAYLYIVALLLLSAVSSHTAMAESGFGQQFPGQVVSLVAVNPQQPNEVAAVVSGNLELTQTNGVLWKNSPLPAVVRTFYFDAVESGLLFAGTDRGLYQSHDYGLSWQLFETAATQFKNVTSVVSTEEGVYALMGNGAGTPTQIYRFTRSGAVMDVTQPAANLSTLVYDASTKRLYAGTGSGVIMSADSGNHWQDLSYGTGQFTSNILAKGNSLLQLSADGLYRSQDGGASWNILARPGDLNHTYYGNDMHVRGLAASNGLIFYGDNSFGYPYRFLVQYDSDAHSVLDYKTNDVASAGDSLWAATDNGLWVSNQLVSSEAQVRRPVIVIPGILGSWPVPASVANHYLWEDLQFWNRSYKTSLVLDPIEHTYDGLMNDLVQKGYENNKTLFAFPYQWRQDNAKTARQLAQKIADVKAICKCAKVDLVGHSMGGLVARQYIQSDYYASDVQNLIQIATPNAGSVNAYAQWEAGDLGLSSSLQDQLFKQEVTIEALHAGHISIVQYIRQNVVAAGQLLPIYNYLTGRIYPTGYPRNQFLENLNIPANIALLKQRVTLYVIGSTSHDTSSTLDVGPPNPGSENYPDGIILNQHSAPGDGTVTDASLEALTHASAYLTGDHGGVVGQSPNFIAQTLMLGYLRPAIDPIESFKQSLLVYVKSPVAISITDPDGLKVDDSDVSVPGAYYTGSDEDAQLVLIPAYKEGIYQIHLTAIGDGGNYSVGVKELGGDGQVGHESELLGFIAAGNLDSYSYDVPSSTLKNTNPPTIGSIPAPDQPDTGINGTVPRPAVNPVEAVAIQSDNTDLALRQEQPAIAVEGTTDNTSSKVPAAIVESRSSNKFTLAPELAILLMICLTFMAKKFYSLYLRK